ncbi:MAG: non-canonical purine NTP pyrophosphatase, partial [Faecalicoccus sp.]|nr:non-canonical purine NTP pyrophosphatase [Faecalicoccus sp.]
MKMKRIWIASSNQHKIEEFQEMMPNVEIKSMKDLKEPVEIIENGKTFEENAMIKARTLWEVVKEPVIS